MISGKPNDSIDIESSVELNIRRYMQMYAFNLVYLPKNAVVTSHHQTACDYLVISFDMIKLDDSIISLNNSLQHPACDVVAFLINTIPNNFTNQIQTAVTV